MNRIWILSDTHTLHNKLTIPDVDMVIHCGDAANSRNLIENLKEFNSFKAWFEYLPIKHKVFIPGNHDNHVERSPTFIKNECDFHVLIHDYLEIDGFRIFGSPYTPSFGNWAFNVRRSDLHDYWQQIPECDILATHGPSRGILDLTDDYDNKGKPIQVGCNALRKRLESLELKLHCFGHLHSHPSKGFYNTGAIFDKFWRINASCVNDGDMKLKSSGFVYNLNDNSIKPVL